MITLQTLILITVSSLITGIVGALIAFLVTTITTRKVMVGIVKELVDTHEKVYHKNKKEPSEMIKEHIEECKSIKNINKLKLGLIFLVEKQGGKAEELGLVW